jgi:hypothetical protein
VLYSYGLRSRLHRKLRIYCWNVFAESLHSNGRGADCNEFIVSLLVAQQRAINTRTSIVACIPTRLLSCYLAMLRPSTLQYNSSSKTFCTKIFQILYLHISLPHCNAQFGKRQLGRIRTVVCRLSNADSDVSFNIWITGQHVVAMKIIFVTRNNFPGFRRCFFQNDSLLSWDSEFF